MAEGISYQAVPVLVGRAEADGRIVFSQGRLVAILTQLSGAHYEHLEGRWYMEAGFGPCADTRPDPFETLDQAGSWIGEVVGALPSIV